jgi:EAL domain-containing protein (putative c-di-GMP-specific phosphodiesterase class I)
MRYGRHDALTGLPNRGPLAHRGQRARLRRELRRVITGAQLTVHYQPIVSLRTGAVCGLEALARWPQGGTVLAPTEFIAAAEDTGMIAALGRYVLETALHTLAGWRRAGVVAGDVGVSVNLSARQLEHSRFAGQVRGALASAGLTADALKLELTESTPIADLQGARRALAGLCADGVGLHLDDFGTGCSSLTALHRLPVDALKIDRSFVAGLGERDGAAEVIIGSTVAMAHGLGLPVIAEGIEHPDQLERVQALGCDFGQGHLFSPALDVEEMGARLAGWSGWAAPVELVAA